MALRPYTAEELNYFKFSSIVINEFPKALRQTFKTMWDSIIGHRRGFQLWDDSSAVRNLFVSTEGGRTKVPTHKSYNEWDCTALFQATIYAQTFASHHRTLSYLYVRPRGVPDGSFHASVVSLGGNNAETFALAIDQLRLLRNSICHSFSSALDKVTFDQCVQHTKDAFTALGLKTDPIDAIGSLTESDFPTKEVRKLEQSIRDEARAYIKFLEGISSDIDELRSLSASIKQKVEDDTANKDDIAMLEQKMSKMVAAQEERVKDETQAHTNVLESVSSGIEELKRKIHGDAAKKEDISMLERKIEDLKVAHEERDEEETQKHTKILESVSSNIEELRREVEKHTSSKDDIAMLQQTMDETKTAQDKRDTQGKNAGTNAFLPRCCLPPVVPNFTGRQNECEEIIGHVTAQSTRMVSIWGSPGFGKTSVAITVGHILQSQRLPVCWISLRGLQSKAELTSRLLSFVRQAVSHHQSSSQGLCLDDELCQLFNEISDRCVFILDNADDLLESGLPNVKEEVIGLLEEILRRNEKVKFIVTTRESLEFMKLHFQSHHAVRIRPLDETSSQFLVNELLPKASNSDVRRIIQICGHVPLAMKLLCSSISDEDSVQPNQFLRAFIESSTEGIVEMLDNPDYPTNHRLKFLFNTSFHRLSTQEKEALVCLCILPENFDVNVAAAVLDKTGILSKKILQSLRRKSLLDSSSIPRFFTMHKLLQSFAREEGEREMKETVDNSKCRFYAYYVSRFRELNEQFLEGHSMSAFVAFFEQKESFIESLVESCSDSRTAGDVFDVLVAAELFLDSVFWSSSEAANFHKIYDSALKEASAHGKSMHYRRLIASQAFYRLTWGAGEMMPQFRSKLNEIQTSPVAVSSEVKGKYLCYFGISQLVTGKTEGGVQCLQEALSLLNNSLEQTILRLIVFQILALYYRFQNDPFTSSQFHSKALQECRTMGDTQLLVVPATEVRTMQTHGKNTILNKPLQLQVIYHVKKASECFSSSNTDRFLWNALLTTIKEVEMALSNGTPGLFYFHQNAVSMLEHFSTSKLYTKNIAEEQVRHDQTTLEQCKGSFGETHSSTADSYHSVGITQPGFGDFNSAVESKQHALDIQCKPFGEDHSSTADSYHSLGITQHGLGDFNSAVESKQHALDIQCQLFGEDHSSTADCYHSLGITQNKLGDFNSALESQQRALDIRCKLFGEDHSRIADSYYSLGITQSKLGDFNSALASQQRALDIRFKLFGEDHSSTADSYHSLGITQYKLDDFSSALEFQQRALDIRRKLFGQDHSSTADSYHLLGLTQYKLGDFNSALESQQRALEIRRKLFGEDHSSTADSYHLLGLTQYELNDFSSALESDQRALDIRLKLFGEDHASTADSYHSLGVTQYELSDFSSALESDQRALDIRRKLFGEDHSSTADSYHSLAVTHHGLGDFSSAVQFHQRALDIRSRLFGAEHPSTADSYFELGNTTYELGDFTLALHYAQCSLRIRVKHFGEEHARTADSYESLGDIQFAMGDSTLAFQNIQFSQNIRQTLLEKETPARLNINIHSDDHP